MHLDAAPGQQLGGHGLDAQIERDHREALLTLGRHDVGLIGADLVCEGRSGHRRTVLHHIEQLGRGALGGGAAEQTDPHRAAFTQMTGQGAGVDLTDPDDLLRPQLLLETV